MSVFKRTCKESAALLVAREDRRLTLLERGGLRVHMWICVTCPLFEMQILTLRNAMVQWRSYQDSEAGPVDGPADRLAGRPAGGAAAGSVGEPGASVKPADPSAPVKST